MIYFKSKAEANEIFQIEVEKVSEDYCWVVGGRRERFDSTYAWIRSNFEGARQAKIDYHEKIIRRLNSQIADEQEKLARAKALSEK